MMLFILTLLACAPPDTPAGPLIWQGPIYEDIPTDGTAGLASGFVRVSTTDGNVIAEGTQPDPERPTTWRISLPGTPEEVEVRIGGPDQLTTVWRTTLPTSRSYWFAGTFFAVKASTLIPLWDSLAELTGEEAAPEEGVALYGDVLALTDDDALAWTDAEVMVQDPSGGVYPVTTLTTTATGALDLTTSTPGPVSVFTATGLPSGPLRLIVDASDGRSVVVDYTAEPGELLSAFSFTLPEDS